MPNSNKISKKRSRKDLNDDEEDSASVTSSSSIFHNSNADPDSSPRLKRRKSVNSYEYRDANGELVNTSYSGQFSPEQLQTLKSELKDEVVRDLKTQLKNEIKSELKEELKYMFSHETNTTIKKLETDVVDSESTTANSDGTQSSRATKSTSTAASDAIEEKKENGTSTTIVSNVSSDKPTVSLKDKETSLSTAVNHIDTVSENAGAEIHTKEGEHTSEKPKFVFGKTAFGSSIASPSPFGSVSKSTEKTPLADADKTEKKPVFGSRTPFGTTSYKDLPKKNVFEELPSSSSTIEKSAKVPQSKIFGSTFGSNSKFGNAFQETLKKKSIFDNPDPNSSDETDEDEKPEEAPTMYKQVELERKEIQSGEEEETSLFNTNCKVFELDLSDIKQGWKERGIGQLHLNKNKKTGKSRIIIRSNGLLRVMLNLTIVKNFDIAKGMLSSMQSEKFFRITVVDHQNRPVQYAIKLSNSKLRDSLYGSIEKLSKDLENEEINASAEKSTGVKWLDSTSNE